MNRLAATIDGVAFVDVELVGDVARRLGDGDVVEHDLGFGAVALQQLGEVDGGGEIVGETGPGGSEVADPVALHDQPALHEGGDRRSDRRPADPELAGQLVLGWQLVSGCQLAADELLVEDLFGLHRERWLTNGTSPTRPSRGGRRCCAHVSPSCAWPVPTCSDAAAGGGAVVGHVVRWLPSDVDPTVSFAQARRKSRESRCRESRLVCGSSATVARRYDSATLCRVRSAVAHLQRQGSQTCIK